MWKWCVPHHFHTVFDVFLIMLWPFGHLKAEPWTGVFRTRQGVCAATPFEMACPQNREFSARAFAAPQHTFRTPTIPAGKSCGIRTILSPEDVLAAC